jgi:formamidopyrimidine-DNA glycosylase
MSGRLHHVPDKTPRSDHEHVILGFDDGSELRFHDTRKFGRLYLLERAEKILGRLGPEPLEPGFTAQRFAQMLKARCRLLKPLLLDQSFLAGLGNIYVDEALWESGLHPQRRSDLLSAAEARALHAAIRRVLRRGIKNLGTSLGTGKANFYSVSRRRGRNRDELKVFRRTGEPCPRCGSEIRRIVVGQRSTHLCSRCQKKHE